MLLHHLNSSNDEKIFYHSADKESKPTLIKYTIKNMKKKALNYLNSLMMKKDSTTK